jgi:hypothetical protein
MTDKVPAIGGARGVFEIFIPGLFLLLNLWATLYLLPFTDEITKRYLQMLISRPSLGAVVIIPFGYLTGVILRLFRTDLPDRHSGLFQRLFRGRSLKNEQALWVHETFPYPGWLAYLVEHRFPKEAKAFFSQLCSVSPESHETDDPRKRKQFINFCKVVVSSADLAAAIEIYSAESLCRYISGMYYALCFSLLMLITVAVSRLYISLPVGLGIISLVVSYVIGIVAILANFRFIRIKEVETIFAAIYKNRELFMKDKDQANDQTPV